MEISLLGLGEKVNNEGLLYSESQGRIVVSVNPKKAKKFEEIMKKCFCVKAGKVTKEKSLVIKDKQDKKIIDLKLDKMFKSYQERLAKY